MELITPKYSYGQSHGQFQIETNRKTNEAPEEEEKKAWTSAHCAFPLLLGPELTEGATYSDNTEEGRKIAPYPQTATARGQPNIGKRNYSQT